MTRTSLTVTTAALLALGSAGLMASRAVLLGDEVKGPTGPGTWRLTLLVHGTLTGSNARLLTATPLDFGRQHILRESFKSAELADKPPESRHPDRRQVIWTQRAGAPAGPFRARSEFLCSVDVHRPTTPMARLSHAMYAPPKADEYRLSEPLIQSDHPDVRTAAREQTADRTRPDDQVEALFRFVEKEITSEPSLGGAGGSALECLRDRSGDAAARGRLLVALCRARDVPARLVTGVNLVRSEETVAHHWAEAWVNGRWISLCPLRHHFGQVPGTYLVFGFGDLPIVRDRNAAEVAYGFLVERVAGEATGKAAGGWAGWARRGFESVSLFMLPPAEQRLVEFLLLLPVAALIVCVYRNLIGLHSFGTFAPALLGLAFRDLHTLVGLTVFVGILLVGWVMRRVLDRFHLLQVPRTAFLLSLVVIVLIGTVVAGNFRDLPATTYVPLFPMVILTGMIERFWTLETEDGMTASFRTLVTTVFIAGTIAVVLSFAAVPRQMFRYPETLGLIMAAQLVMGRYTGYRLMELVRFRDFVSHTEQEHGAWMVEEPVGAGAGR